MWPRARLAALAPRRRLLALGLTAVVLVAVLVGVVLDVTRGGSTPVPQGTPGPVLLVPGYGGDLASLADLATRLRAAGRDVTVVNLGTATGDIDGQADTLGRAVSTALHRTHAPSVDLVGYSDGGIVVRDYVKFHGGASRVRRVVTLGSPHHGTNLAAAAGSLIQGACVDACAQVLPGSSFLARLNRGDETPAGPTWLSLWTDDDQTVTPPTSARLAGAIDVPVQSVCADDHDSHGDLPRDRLVIGIVLSAIGAGPMTTPGPADCAALRAAG